MDKKKNLAKKIAVALVCAATLPTAGHAVNDFEANQTYLAGGCGAANGQYRNQNYRGSSCAAYQGYRGQGCSSDNGGYAGYGGHGCGAATPSHGCGATPNHGCGAAPSHGCGSSANDQVQHQRDPSYFQPSHNSPNYPYGQTSHGSSNQNPYGQTSYTGTSTGPGPNDGYPATPRGTSSTIYSSNPNAVDGNNVNRR